MLFGNSRQIGTVGPGVVSEVKSEDKPRGFYIICVIFRQFDFCKTIKVHFCFSNSYTILVKAKGRSFYWRTLTAFLIKCVNYSRFGQDSQEEVACHCMEGNI